MGSKTCLYRWDLSLAGWQNDGSLKQLMQVICQEQYFNLCFLLFFCFFINRLIGHHSPSLLSVDCIISYKIHYIDFSFIYHLSTRVCFTQTTAGSRFFPLLSMHFSCTPKWIVFFYLFNWIKSFLQIIYFWKKFWLEI